MRVWTELKPEPVIACEERKETEREIWVEERQPDNLQILVGLVLASVPNALVSEVRREIANAAHQINWHCYSKQEEVEQQELVILAGLHPVAIKSGALAALLRQAGQYNEAEYHGAQFNAHLHNIRMEIEQPNHVQMLGGSGSNADS